VGILKVGTLKVGTPKVDTPKVDTTKVGILKVGTPKIGTPKVGTPKIGTPKIGTPKVGTPKVGTPKIGTPKVGTPKVGTPKGSGIHCPDCGTIESVLDFYHLDPPWSFRFFVGTGHEGIYENHCRTGECLNGFSAASAYGVIISIVNRSNFFFF
jgi:hypothetical protein